MFFLFFFKISDRRHDDPPRCVRLAARLVQLLVGVVVLDVVVQQTGLPERLGAARRRAFERVVVQLDGQDGGRLVLYHAVH